MTGKSRIVRPVQACRTACRTDTCFTANGVQLFFQYAVGKHALYRVVFYNVVYRVDVIEHRDIRTMPHGICQNRLDVLAVDFDVSIAARDVISIFILQNDQAQFFQMVGYLVETLAHAEQQILPHNAVRVFLCVIYVKFRRFSRNNICVERIDARCQAAAAADVRLFQN